VADAVGEAENRPRLRRRPPQNDLSLVPLIPPPLDRYRKVMSLLRHPERRQLQPLRFNSLGKSEENLCRFAAADAVGEAGVSIRWGTLAYETVAGSIVGGTTSELTEGTFESGASTAAMGRLFNSHFARKSRLLRNRQISNAYKANTCCRAILSRVSCPLRPPHLVLAVMILDKRSS